MNFRTLLPSTSHSENTIVGSYINAALYLGNDRKFLKTTLSVFTLYQVFYLKKLRSRYSSRQMNRSFLVWVELGAPVDSGTLYVVLYIHSVMY
jgi:hypothetical protein